MKKSIILSLVMVVAIGAAVISYTGAFFSDTETSSGNTFTAGAIDLKVDSQCSYNGVVTNQNCVGNWGQKSDVNPLGGIDIAGEKFFDFSDIKPGDFGENTISLHVDNNNAWGCAAIKLQSDADMTCTEPEMADDATCGTDVAPFNGEIAENLSLAWWPDDGDNVLEMENGEYDKMFFLNGSKLATLLNGGDMLNLTLADSYQNFFTNSNSGALTGAQTYYVGMAWCFGNMTIDPISAAITCDGGPVNNAAQSDKLIADLSFYVVQSRNNTAFRCEDTYKPQVID